VVCQLCGSMKAYRYMVNRNGVVQRWETPLDPAEFDPNHISMDTIARLSPMPEPEPSTTDVAQALLHIQRESIKKSFRTILPEGAFHDSIMDGQSGRELAVSTGAYYNVKLVVCPAGLVRCPDHSCVASMSYCPGCERKPMPEFCSANAESPSGWRPSMIGCDENTTDVANCGMKNGQGLYLPGESVSEGYVVGGLA
jgi:hypothetical protein